MNIAISTFFLVVGASACVSISAAVAVRLKDIGRFDGWRENYITGVGLVSGLAGTGDSARSRVTRQALANVVSRFDLNIPEGAIASRNVAVVMVTAALPPFSRSGDRIDVTVSSVGDAKSLSGGSLLLTPLKGPDDQIYCLAQGQINVSGYRVEQNESYVQSNHPTAGLISSGCTVERSVISTVMKENNRVVYLLNDPDYSLAHAVSEQISKKIPDVSAKVRDAGAVEIQFDKTTTSDMLAGVMSSIESVQVETKPKSRVVINERSGLIVAGADVSISPVSITQGDLRVTVTTGSVVSQPLIIGRSGTGVQTVVTRDSQVKVEPASERVISVHSGNTVSDLVSELTRQKVGIRQIVAVLQALRAGGALYADIVIQ